MSKAIVGNSEEARQIARILGIDVTRCTGFDVSVRASELVTVTVYKYAEVDGDLVSVPRMFNLVPVSEPKP